ncbi:MAG: type II secretion system F family protein [Candidatus Dadabacteria bacterium]|nr:MAG: type II secretion system F family protein [Candidatus Dadabacteria bacterium]
MGRELPGLTVAVINLSHWMQDNLWTVLGSIAAFVVFFKVITTFEKVNYVLDFVKLKIPLIGNLIHKTALTRFNQTLGTLLASGVPIVDSLQICKGVVGNRIIAQDVDLAIEGIREGKTFVEPLSESKYFPQMMIQMVEVGESTGRLDQMLERVSAFYEEQVEAAVEAITSAIEPIMMVFLGGIVGTLLGAMYMPIFTMAGG